MTFNQNLQDFELQIRVDCWSICAKKQQNDMSINDILSYTIIRSKSTPNFLNAISDGSFIEDEGSADAINNGKAICSGIKPDFKIQVDYV